MSKGRGGKEKGGRGGMESVRVCVEIWGPVWKAPEGASRGLLVCLKSHPWVLRKKRDWIIGACAAAFQSWLLSPKGALHSRS